MIVKSVQVNSELNIMSLEEIFKQTGADLEKEVMNITPLTGGKWFKLPKPIMVDTIEGKHPCTDVWLNGNTNYIEIEMEDGTILKATHHHKFLVKNGDSVEWKMAINLTEDDDIVKCLNEMDSDEGVTVDTMSIKSIRSTSDRIITMDINVETVHSYVLENGLVSHNSSISGATTNGVYPIRNYFLNKTNDSLSLSYVVPDSTRLKDKYESAWDISVKDMIEVYAIIQKWTDQGISSDYWFVLNTDAKVSASDMIKQYIMRYKYGHKSKYYTNSLTSKKGLLDVPTESVGQDCETCSI